MHACVDRVQSRKRDVRTELRPGQRCVPQQLLQVPDVRATIVHERCHRMRSASRARRSRPTSSLRAKRFLTAVSRRARTWRRHCGSGTAQLGAALERLTTVAADGGCAAAAERGVRRDCTRLLRPSVTIISGQRNRRTKRRRRHIVTPVRRSAAQDYDAILVRTD